MKNVENAEKRNALLNNESIEDKKLENVTGGANRPSEVSQSAPKLPAQNLVAGGYDGMFQPPTDTSGKDYEIHIYTDPGTENPFAK